MAYIYDASYSREPVARRIMTDQSQSRPTDSGNQSIQAMVAKIVELQDKIVENQEKNIMLSTQLREMEMMARDADDLRTEVANQSALLTDKSRENKRLHEDLAKLGSLLEEKIGEVDELKSMVVDLQHQLKQRESERDLLAVMLTEKEQQQHHQQATASTSGTFEAAEKDKPLGWLNPFGKGKS